MESQDPLNLVQTLTLQIQIRQAYIILGTIGTIEQYNYLYIYKKNNNLPTFCIVPTLGTFWNKWNTILEQNKR